MGLPTEFLRPGAGRTHCERKGAASYEDAVDGEAVAAQEGDFYGGWIMREIEGPFQGGPGTRGW